MKGRIPDFERMHLVASANQIALMVTMNVEPSRCRSELSIPIPIEWPVVKVRCLEGVERRGCGGRAVSAPDSVSFPARP